MMRWGCEPILLLLLLSLPLGHFVGNLSGEYCLCSNHHLETALLTQIHDLSRSAVVMRPEAMTASLISV